MTKEQPTQQYPAWLAEMYVPLFASYFQMLGEEKLYAATRILRDAGKNNTILFNEVLQQLTDAGVLTAEDTEDRLDQFAVVHEGYTALKDLLNARLSAWEAKQTQQQ